MIGKIISLPFWVIGKLFGGVSMVFRMIFKMGFGAIRFVSNHILGTLFGALIGFLLGRKHVGVKLFTHRHKAHSHHKK